MEESVLLKLLGITYNQIESGVYALILEDPEEGRRLPIVIGYPEAQSIECKLQNVKIPRPLAHDLLAKIIEDLGGSLIRVDIHKLRTGPYAGRLTLIDAAGNIKEVDARSSDAVALAIRVGAPIYTSRELLEREGFVPSKSNKKETDDKMKEGATQMKGANKKKEDWSKYSLDRLKHLLTQYVEEENYEEAAKVKAEIDRRSNPEK
ncbi:MAG: bifunctional nuclease family protein [Muribaculaceae bacterium]|nr:bifunctional nuclease family protein [Muribaculaceae bacterium]